MDVENNTHTSRKKLSEDNKQSGPCECVTSIYAKERAVHRHPKWSSQLPTGSLTCYMQRRLMFWFGCRKDDG